MLRTTLNPETVIALSQELVDRGIPIAQWGQGNAKRVEDLLREIRKGDTVLIADGQDLLREVKVAGVNVKFISECGIQQLYEDQQILGDGRVRHRKDLFASMTEKVQKGERPSRGARRGIKEELGAMEISNDVKLAKTTTASEIRESPSYPGLPARYIKHIYDLDLKPGDFNYNPDGYSVREGENTTVFKWR